MGLRRRGRVHPHPCGKESAGTDIVLHIKQNTEDDHYDEYLEQYRLAELVKKYSDYIHYPIVMLMHVPPEAPAPRTRRRLQARNGRTSTSGRPLNSMVPLWQRPKSEVTRRSTTSFIRRSTATGRIPERGARVRRGRGGVQGHALYPGPRPL